MKETIYTIPINEIFEENSGCPICTMNDKLEERYVDYIIGAAMMEPDVRIETNRLGFCYDHYGMMLKRRNRLGIALTLESHLNEVYDRLISGKAFKEVKNQKSASIGTTCYVCNRIDNAMVGMLSNIYKMYSTDAGFRKLYSNQKVICYDHCRLLINGAKKNISKKLLAQFEKETIRLTTEYLKELKGDVSHFCRMFDYRSNSQDNADWGNSKDSVERAIWFMTSKKV